MTHSKPKRTRGLKTWQGVLLAVVLLSLFGGLWYVSAPALHVENRCVNLPEWASADRVDVDVYSDYLLFRASTGLTEKSPAGGTNIMWLNDFNSLKVNRAESVKEYQTSRIFQGTITDYRSGSPVGLGLVLYFASRTYITSYRCFIPTD